jgi:parallel beta-helix repeat protein
VNILTGTLTSNTTLSASSSWSIVSNVTVASGVTLTVQNGVDVAVAPGAKLTVNGSLVVTGTSGSRVVFRSSEATPTTGSWEGIWIGSGGTATIDYADIRHGRHAVSAVNASGTISITNTLFTDFGRGQGMVPGAGVWIKNSLAEIEDCTFTHPLPLNGGTNGIHMIDAVAGSLVSGNSIEDVIVGLYLEDSSPDVEGNEIADNVTGIHIKQDSAPQITNENLIHDNEWGVRIDGVGNLGPSPAPVINGNDITSNDDGTGGTLRNLTANTFGTTVVAIDASGNWWGTTDPLAIEDGIFDRMDGGYTDGPYVDFVPFLGASVTAGGTPVSGNLLAGAVTGSTTLTAGTWDVVGSYVVAPGGTLTIAPGATVRVTDGGAIDVDGTLEIEGTSGSPVLLTSKSASPTRGIWKGVVIRAGTASVVDYAEIRWAERAVSIQDASATVSNSYFRDFSVAGIYVSNGGGTLADNTIDNTNDTATGIYLSSASPAITGNDIRNTQVGLYLQGASNPVVNGSNVITSNRIGIQLNGGYPGGPPNPVVNDNDLYDNVWSAGDVRNLQLSGYYHPDEAFPTLDFRRNWWGSTDPGTILAGIEDQSVQAAAVDVSSFRTSAGGSTSSTPVFTIPIGNVRRSATAFSAGLGGSVTILFDLYTDATVTLKLYDEDDGSPSAPVRSISQAFTAGNDRSFVWNGTDDAGALVNEEAYAYALTASYGAGSFTWNPAEPPPINPPGSGGGFSFLSAGTGPTSFNTYRNVFWQRDVNITNSVRVDFIVTPVGSTTGFKVFEKIAYPAGTPKIVWDGRDLAGQIVANAVQLKLFMPDNRLRYNHVIVQDVDPNVRGVAPYVEVKSNPWYVVHSYGQLAKVAYHVDQPAAVTVKLLPPGIADPNHASAITMLPATAQAAGDHTVEWTGPAAADPNLVRFAEEGAFTFTIQALNTATGRSALYRGVLQVRR